MQVSGLDKNLDWRLAKVAQFTNETLPLLRKTC